MILDKEVFVNKFTHIAGGVTACALFAHTKNPSDLAIAGFFALLPDIDQSNSTLGKFNPLAKVLKHRGFCHSLLFALLVSSAFQFLFGRHIALCVLIGMTSHLVLDLFNYSGEELLWPVKINITCPFIHVKSGGIFDYIIGCALYAYLFIFLMDNFHLTY